MESGELLLIGFFYLKRKIDRFYKIEGTKKEAAPASF